VPTGLQVKLAVSLHAANDQERSRLLPANRRFPLAELMAACQYYVQQTGRR
jgi:23S rRNA (adenine2503-C2)-methyltransferase